MIANPLWIWREKTTRGLIGSRKLLTQTVLLTFEVMGGINYYGVLLMRIISARAGILAFIKPFLIFFDNLT